MIDTLMSPDQCLVSQADDSSTWTDYSCPPTAADLLLFLCACLQMKPGTIKGGICEAKNDDGSRWTVNRIGPFITTGGYDWYCPADCVQCPVQDVLYLTTFFRLFSLSVGCRWAGRTSGDSRRSSSLILKAFTSLPSTPQPSPEMALLWATHLCTSTTSM